MGFIQDINEVFGKWFNGEHLREDEVEFIIYNIITPCGDKFLKPHKSSSSSIPGV